MNYRKLSLTLLSLFITTATFAADLQESDINIINYLSDGYIQVEFPYYDDDGRDDFLKYDLSSYISIENENVLTMRASKVSGGTQSKEPYWLEINPSNQYDDVYVIENDGYDAYMTYGGYNLSQKNWKRGDRYICKMKIYPRSSYFKNSSLNVKVFLRDDKSFGGERDILKTAKFSITPFQLPSVSLGLSSTPGYQTISFTYNTKGRYFVYVDDEEIDSNKPSDVGSNIKVDIPISNEPRKAKVVFREWPSPIQSYIDYETSFAIPAYYMPGDFSATLNADADVELQWWVKADKFDSEAQILDGDWEVERADNPDFKDAKNIGKVSVKKNARLTQNTMYGLVDKTSDENINGTYYYRLHRTGDGQTWQWDPSVVSTCSLDIQMRHRYVKEAHATIDNGTVTITWDWDNGQIKSDKDEVYIVRTNVTSKETWDPIKVSAQAVKDRCYTEMLQTSCDVYSYKIYLRPENNKYTEQEPMDVLTDGELYSADIGNVVGLNASKGYYNDRVMLTWSTDGNPINTFLVMAREHGSGKEYTQIDRMTNDGLNTYKYNDMAAIPGIIYDYQIWSMTTCAGRQTYEHSETVVGFRRATGDIYGSVTFESGQPVSDVTITTEATEDNVIDGQAYSFGASGQLSIDNRQLLAEADEFTLQAWISPMSDGTLMSKGDMWRLSINADHPTFEVAGQSISTDETIDQIISRTHSNFMHISAVAATDSIYIYINGARVASAARASSVSPQQQHILMGTGYTGVIDEVRLWSRALDADVIARDYNRYLRGNEDGLEAYYPFDIAVEGEFYDFSYQGNYYNENHGSASGGVELQSTYIPDSNQLAYRGVTDENGAYNVRGLPYCGNGTSYAIVPSKGNHTFSPVRELRLLSTSSPNHTINYVDKSSFDVSGRITYAGGNVPVEGVGFKVDGSNCFDSKNQQILTDKDGRFTISVPVGTHEVVAFKGGHTFANRGRITNSDGTDRNYQDNVNGIELTDSTTVKFIGRLAGGTVQEGHDVGFSLSTNNLGDATSLVLTYPNDAYTMRSDSLDVIEEHFVPAYRTGAEPNTNRVVTYGNTVTIYPNQATGEFVAYVIPELFNVKVNAPGYESATKNMTAEIDLAKSVNENEISHTFTDSIKNGSEIVVKKYEEKLKYHESKKFIVRVQPQIELKQMATQTMALPYFGEKSVQLYDMKSGNKTFDTWADGKYALGRPVFAQGVTYRLRARVHEAYDYYDCDGNVIDGHATDMVPVSNAKVTFVCEPESKDPVTVDADTLGIAMHTFKCGTPDMVSGVSNVAVSARIGDDASFAWRGSELSQFITLGIKLLGNDFVTAGPDRLITVLRDPPGSQSYSYIEKGATFKNSSTTKHGLKNEGNITAANKIVSELSTVFVPTGQIIGRTEKTETGGELGVVHSYSSSWGGNQESETTFTTNFQTSSNPDYVGALADVYVGYSTNLTFGTAKNVNIITNDTYRQAGGQGSMFKVYDTVTPEDADILLVSYEATNISESFETLFAYPQCYIEQMMLPNYERLRANLLHQEGEMTPDEFASLATSTHEPVYVSHFAPDHPDYGRSNSDMLGTGESIERTGRYMDGKSYKVYYPEDADTTYTDKVNQYNQAIKRWQGAIRENEREKVNAQLVQNYSMQSGSTISYSEEMSFSTSSTHSYEVTTGLATKQNFDFTFFGCEHEMTIQEELRYVNEKENEDESGNNVKIGFELADSDGYDYISVDVMRESNGSIDAQNPDKYQSSFIFKTRAGATMCPYEGEQLTHYYEPGRHVLSQATLQIDVPKISMENQFIENVPSGEAAALTVYLRNESEMVGGDCIFLLKEDDSTNPDGLQIILDGAGLGAGRAIYVPAGQTVSKTLLAKRAAVLDYDNVKLMLVSNCQNDPTAWNPVISDEVTFSVHFTPSATDVHISEPNPDWVYNLNMPTETIDNTEQHYMEVRLDGFDINYDNFHRIMLQYKPSSSGDTEWVTLMSYYADQALCDQALANGQNASLIDAADKGIIRYKWFMDKLMDQNYDLRAVGSSLINNVEYTKISEVYHGLKDMEPLRLFGTPQPGNGILGIGDEIRINFNKAIAKGYVNSDNFQVTGIRNGAKSDHSVSVSLDGGNDRLVSELNRNLADKDFTVEMWVNAHAPQSAVYFAHGPEDTGMEFGITVDNKLYVNIAGTKMVSDKAVDFKSDEWAHVAVVYDKSGTVSAYYNYVAYITGAPVSRYQANGIYACGSKTSGGSYFEGKVDNLRIWDKAMSAAQLKGQSNVMLSGTELNLLAYYPMDSGVGSQVADRAHSLPLMMEGAQWSLPEGRSATFDGSAQYVRIPASSAVIEQSMDFTIEMWFKAGRDGNDNAALVANGLAEGDSKEFYLGFVDGILTFRNNGVVSQANGNWLDDDWHHVAVAVSRDYRRGQFVIDGKLNTYFSSEQLGSLASAYMTIGAREYDVPAEHGANSVVDCLLKGSVDDFRIWNLYKSEELLSVSNNIQLDGDEVGLLAYYPFEKYIEWQGKQELQFSLEDAKALNDAASAGSLCGEAIGGDLSSSVTAPVKSKGEVSKLQFDYVVNDDAIIISLLEDLNRIENTTVSFAVDGIRDVNGNPLVSPVLWTAFIDRNQLRWVESEYSGTISESWLQDNEFSLPFNIINKGGYNINYKISNMPSWLTVTPSSGKLGPGETRAISLSIGKDVNVGSYNEIIYLTGDNDIPECLPFNLTVEPTGIDWSVNPADYAYTMSVVGKIKINNEFSADSRDILAAFSKDDCVGVTTSSYAQVNDMYYALLTIYGNEPKGDDLKFRIWDASTGMQYIALPDRDITFANNTVIGDTYSPVIFSSTGLKEQTIPLNRGWSWISINVSDPLLSDINGVLGGYEWSNDDIVKSEMLNKASNYCDGAWIGPLSSLTNTTMYHLKTSTVPSLKVIGMAVDLDNTSLKIEGTDANGYKRWNYIPYLPSAKMDVNSALAGYEAVPGDIVKSQSGFAMYSDNLGWIGNITALEPGRGYMLQRNAKDTVYLKYPAVVSRSGESDAHEHEGETTALTDMPYMSNMTIVARVTGIDVYGTDRLVAYVDGECRGMCTAMEVKDLGDLYFLTVGGDMPGTLDFVLERDGRSVGRVSDYGTYASNQASGSIDCPVVLNMGDGGDNASVYPRAFTDVLHIDVDADAGARVDVEITDLSGRLVAVYDDCGSGHGCVRLQWHPGDMPQGVYVVMVSVNGHKQAYKTIKI